MVRYKKGGFWDCMTTKIPDDLKEAVDLARLEISAESSETIKSLFYDNLDLISQYALEDMGAEESLDLADVLVELFPENEVVAGNVRKIRNIRGQDAVNSLWITALAQREQGEYYNSLEYFERIEAYVNRLSEYEINFPAGFREMEADTRQKASDYFVNKAGVAGSLGKYMDALSFISRAVSCWPDGSKKRELERVAAHMEHEYRPLLKNSYGGNVQADR